MLEFAGWIREEYCLVLKRHRSSNQSNFSGKCSPHEKYHKQERSVITAGLVLDGGERWKRASVIYARFGQLQCNGSKENVRFLLKKQNLYRRDYPALRPLGWCQGSVSIWKICTFIVLPAAPTPSGDGQLALVSVLICNLQFPQMTWNCTWMFNNVAVKTRFTALLRKVCHNSGMANWQHKGGQD